MRKAEPAPPAPAPPPAAPRKPGFYEAVAIYERGVQALQRHDFRAPPDFFRTVLEQYPEERELLERARLYLRVCERETSRQPAGPKTAAERVYAATVALNSGDHTGALDHLQRALGEDPESDHAHYIMAVALGMRDRTDEALEHLRQAIALNPENRRPAPKQDPDLDSLRDHTRFPCRPRHAARPQSPARRSSSLTPIRLAAGEQVHLSPRMADLHVVILAAGKGTRMKSAIPKVLHRAAGLAAHRSRPADGGIARPGLYIVVVVGHQVEQLKEALGKRLGLRFALQEPQLGTGHALLQAEPFLEGARGTVLLLSGDVPLLRRKTLERLVTTHEERSAAATVLTAVVDDPAGYGRVDPRGRRDRRDRRAQGCDAGRAEITEINSGVYAFDLAPLFDALRAIGSANAQGEYYLPDLVRIYRARGLRVEDGQAGRSRRDSRREQPEGAGGRGDDPEIAKERRADGGRRDDRRSSDAPTSIPT